MCGHTLRVSRLVVGQQGGVGRLGDASFELRFVADEGGSGRSRAGGTARPLHAPGGRGRGVLVVSVPLPLRPFLINNVLGFANVINNSNVSTHGTFTLDERE